MVYRPEIARLVAAGAVVVAVAVVSFGSQGGVAASARGSRLAGNTETETGVNYDAMSSVLTTRIMIKDSLINELIAGRVPLIDVANRFTEMNQELPSSEEVVRARYPHLPEAERSALNVIEYVASQEMSEETRKTVLRRLSEEYSRVFGRCCQPQI